MRRGKITFDPREDGDGEEVLRWLKSFLESNELTIEKLTVEICSDENGTEERIFGNERLEQETKDAIRDELEDPDYRRDVEALAGDASNADRYEVLKERRDKRDDKGKGIIKLFTSLVADGWKMSIGVVEHYFKSKL